MKFSFKDLGCISYQEAYSIQKERVEEVLKGGVLTIFLCEHPAILTLGRLACEDNLLVSKEQLVKQKILVEHIDRGGEVTLHSPGQLVVYPIINLNFFKKDLHEYMRKLEQVAIELLKDFGIVSDRFSGRTGVWVGHEKIVSIGVGVKKWITFHGMAININTDLELFSMIKPCGLEVSMTSVSKIKNQKIDMDNVKEKLIQKFCLEFKAENKYV